MVVSTGSLTAGAGIGAGTCALETDAREAGAGALVSKSSGSKNALDIATSIEVVLVYVLNNTVWHEIPNRVSIGGTLTHIC